MPNKDALTPRLEELKPLETSLLVDGSSTDFNLYITIQGQTVLYAASPYVWSQKEIERLQRSGHLKLYFLPEEESRVLFYQKLIKIPSINSLLSPQERLAQWTEVAGQLTQFLYETPLGESALAKINEVAHGMVEAIEEDRSIVTVLKKLAHHDHYTYFHSARVCAYALALAIQMSVTRKEHLLEIAQGCLLHDIGKSKVDVNIINKPGPLSEKEWSLIKQHPEWGHELVDETPLSFISKSMILHHHERLDGKGYPHKLTKNEILPEVKIASFADVFDALTTNRSYHVSKTRHEALHYIKDHLLDGLDIGVFKAMVEIYELGKS